MTDEPRQYLSVRETEKDNEILFDFQYDILARKYFLKGKIKEIDEKIYNGNSIYEMLTLYYDFFNLNEGEDLHFPYGKEEFEVRKEKLYDEKVGNINLITMIFPKDVHPGVGQKVKVLYNDEKVHYYVFENTDYNDDSHNLNEVGKYGITRYYRIENDDNIENDALLGLWNVDSQNKSDYEIWRFDEQANLYIPKKNLLKYKKSVGILYNALDCIKTSRGIQVGDNINKVFEKYGKVPIYDFDRNTDVFYEEYKDAKIEYFNEEERYCDYEFCASYRNALMRFYFDEDSRVKLIGFIVRNFR